MRAKSRDADRHSTRKTATPEVREPARQRAGPHPAGLQARRLAVALIEGVLDKRAPLDEATAADSETPLEPRDRAFARLIAATVVRRLGTLERVLARFLEKPLPKDGKRAKTILLAAAAQLVLLGTPPHAAISLAVEQCRRDRLARRFDRLANAVLRKVATEGAAIMARLDAPRVDIPGWLWQRWSAAYGSGVASQIAAASLREAALDLSVQSDALGWADRLGGRLLPTGSVRLVSAGRIEDLTDYADGAWWVQDAAAALPVRLLGPVEGLDVADLCAAPGGKTAQLATAGARVTAVDVSPLRLATVQQNLARLRLGHAADLVQADIEIWSPGRQFDAVLLDAPCSATGTLRRHPDILRLKSGDDIRRLAVLQATLLDRARHLIKPGGRLVYCTCSLEPEECERQVERVLAEDATLARVPIRVDEIGEIGGGAGWISPSGDLRTMPFYLPLEPPEWAGMDAFYAARITRVR